MKVSQEVIESCNSIEDVLNVKTENGAVRCASIGNDGQDYSSFISRYKFFKERLEKDLPELSTEEILKFYDLYFRFTDTIFEYHPDFISILDFEYRKGLL